MFLTDQISHQKRKAETESAIAATEETRAVAPLSTKVKLKSVVQVDWATWLVVVSLKQSKPALNEKLVPTFTAANWVPVSAPSRDVVHYSDKLL